MSEIFLTAWRRQHDYRHDEARLWSFTVARGVVANVLRARDGLAIAEAAEVCQCSQGTFRVRLFRARRRFAAKVSPTLFDQDH